MENSEQLKEIVREKYSEIALKEKKPINHPATVLVIALPKYTTL